MSTDNENDNDVPERKPVTATLQEHRKGALVAELGDDLAEVVEAVQRTGKKGSVTLKLEVSPTKDGYTVFLSDDIKKSVPKEDKGGSLMFSDANGNLHRNDPNQMKLERFHVVETSNNEPVVVDTGTGEVREIN